LLDEFIVGYIRQRKLQCLLISLRFHASCRKDNQKGGDISIYNHFLCFVYFFFTVYRLRTKRVDLVKYLINKDNAKMVIPSA